MPAAATTHNENNKVEADHGRQENEWGLRLGGWGGKAELGVTNTVKILNLYYMCVQWGLKL